MRKILTIALAVLAGALLLRSYIFSVGDAAIPVHELTVAPGDTLYTLPAKLDLYDPPAEWRWKAFVRLEYPDYSLAVGTYPLRTDLTVRSLLDTVLSSSPALSDASLTILPGWNVYDVDAAFARAGLAPAGAVSAPSSELMAELRAKYPFLEGDTLEGYLYPDTYRLDPKSSLAAMLSRPLDRFAEKISDPAGLSPERLYDTLRLASIVEREERDSANKAIVAGILAKRLDEWIALGADATVCYAYRLTHDACTPSFIAAHISESSDYNTRAQLGLPPTPISNMTDETFFASLHPKTSPYYYYLHDDTGAIRYGRTLAEHNENRRIYLGR